MEAVIKWHKPEEKEPPRDGIFIAMMEGAETPDTIHIDNGSVVVFYGYYPDDDHLVVEVKTIKDIKAWAEMPKYEE